MISIILPILNEEANLTALYERLTAASETWGEDYEVIAVDDGSTDKTLSLLGEIHRRDPRWRVLTFSRNFGHQVAVSAGLYYARGDCAAVLDADLQDPPEVLEQFLNKWREGYEVVYAVRRKRKENIFKRAAYGLFYRLLARMSAIPIPLDSGDFCVIDRKVLNVLRAMPERNRFVRGLRSWAGFRQIGIEYERAGRAAGQPKYTFRKLLNLAIDGLVSFSYVPLKLASWMGFLFSAAAFLALVFFVIHRIFDFKIFGYSPRDVPGMASIVCAILLLGGVQLLCIGALGEYLGRIFDEAKRRPKWIIRDAFGVEPPEDRFESGWFVS